MADTKNKPLEADTSTKKRFHAATLNPIATTGTWAYTLVSNILAFRKAAAATNSVVSIAVPEQSRGGTFGGDTLKSVTVEYAVGTAATSSAPAAVCHKLSVDRTTGATTRTAVAGATAFTGFDTTGVGVGAHALKFTPTTAVDADDDYTLVLEITFNEAATSTLELHGATVESA